MPRILLVEDEAAIADTVLYALRAEGFEAVHCLTGGEALRAGAAQRASTWRCSTSACRTSAASRCAANCASGRELPVIFLTAQRRRGRPRARAWSSAPTTTSPSRSRRANWWRGCGWCCAAAHAPRRPAPRRFEHDAEGKRIRYRGQAARPDPLRIRPAGRAAAAARRGAVARAADGPGLGRRAGQRRPHRRYPRQDAARQAARGRRRDADPIRTHRGLGYSLRRCRHERGRHEDRPAHLPRLLPDRRAGGAAADAGVRRRGQARRAPGDGGHAGRHRQRAGRTGDRRPARRAHRRRPLRAARARAARARLRRARSGASASAQPTTASTSPTRAASSCTTATGRDVGKRLLALERRLPDPARPVRRALHPQRPGRREFDGDARRRADPRRRPHHRRADRGQAQPRARAVHRAQPGTRCCAGAGC